MKNSCILFTLFSFSFFSSAADYYLIANIKSETRDLSVKEVKSIFLGRKTISGKGIIFRPCYVNDETQQTRIFFQEVIKKDYPRFVRYWNKKLFSGGGKLPKEFESTELILDFARREKGSLCLVSKLPEILPKQVIIVSLTE